MKHNLLIITMILCNCLTLSAQHLSGDINGDNKTNIEDVVQLVDIVKSDKKIYSGCASKEYVDSLFRIISIRLDSLKESVRPVDYNGHSYVDLGLSVKWGSCNVGANKPEGYGGYYAWGETKTKSDYSWESYFDSSNVYYYKAESTLEQKNDAAHVVWGGDWRIPTPKEWIELRDNCTWTHSVINGIHGYKVTGKNGCSIFLPAAGYYDGEEYVNVDIYDDGNLYYGLYQSSQLSNSKESYYLLFNCYDNIEFSSHGTRCNGYSVRPVCR